MAQGERLPATGPVPREPVAALSPEALAQLLEITLKLARPFDLETLLAEVVDAARGILDAERGSVFLYDAGRHELVLTVTDDLRSVRIPADQGIAGACAVSRRVVNVSDCYADPRFDPALDRRSGRRTRSLLSLPLINHEDELVGVLQLMNKRGGVFDERDEWIASALAAQAAVALHRARMTEALVAAEKLRHEVHVARDIQMSALPEAMPPLPGYDGAGRFLPTDQTGGDLFDFVPLADGRMFLLLGDATGHGIGPALSATQVRAMIRVGLRLGAGLDDIFAHVNNQLVDDLPDDRFVTAFLGVLDPADHTVRFHAGGQGPLMHFRAASREFAWHGASTFPMGALPQDALDEARCIRLEPGDVLGLISDGIYEYEDPEGRQFGQEGVAEVVRQYHGRPMSALLEALLEAARRFAGTAPQADDVTIVLIRRVPS